MRLRELLTESSNTNLLIIDVQPEYQSYSNKILPGVRSMISKSIGRLVIVYNDFGGGDSATDVYNYITGYDDEADYEYNEETGEYEEAKPTPEQAVLQQKLQRAQFIQKEYGFLRGFMDAGVPDKVIIETLRAMYSQSIYDSQELDITKLSQQTQQVLNDTSKNISVQDFVPIKLLHQLQPFYMMGGGRHECLREIELICHTFNIRFKRIDSLVY
jgi:hypothetical protein